MKKTLLILLILFVYGCNDNPISIGNVSLNKDFDIKYNQTILVRDAALYVTLKDINEGRCPLGVYCFWQGSASIIVDILQGKYRMPDTLETYWPEKVIVIDSLKGSYKFTVKKLIPYPVYGKEIKKNQYVLTLNISDSMNKK